MDLCRRYLVAQLVESLASAQVMVSRVTSLSPTSSLLLSPCQCGACFKSSALLSLFPPLLALPHKNKFKKNFKKINKWVSANTSMSSKVVTQVSQEEDLRSLAKTLKIKQGFFRWEQQWWIEIKIFFKKTFLRFIIFICIFAIAVMHMR